MDRTRMYESDADAEVIRKDFEIQLRAVGIPVPELVRKGPMHYEGPSWISAMWFGFLLSRRTTFLYRDPRFEGDFVKGDTLKDFGIRVMDQDSGSSSSDVRVPAGWVMDVCAGIEAADDMEDEDRAIMERARLVLERPGMRDAAPKK